MRTVTDLEDLEQELVDQFCLAMAGAGITDRHIANERGMLFEFVRFLGRPLWTATPEDADSFMVSLRQSKQAKATVQGKAGALTRFFEFVIARYSGDVQALAGVVVVQPIDEFNRPAKASGFGAPRVPPSNDEIDTLFDGWRAALPGMRKYLPAARDYMAASLWRRIGLRINETAMLDMRDWRPDLGEHGKLHIRYGKGSRGRGPKTRLVPGINSVDTLMDWWLSDVRHQFGDDWEDVDAPLLPSERRDSDTGRCGRVGTNTLRAGMANSVDRWLPTWSGRLTPHGMRHFCASSMYAHGIGLKAIQELLGHEWLSTTTGYIHVHADHIEHAWEQASDRIATRIESKGV